jgi:hypothetical protein
MSKKRNNTKKGGISRSLGEADGFAAQLLNFGGAENLDLISAAGDAVWGGDPREARRQLALWAARALLNGVFPQDVSGFDLAHLLGGGFHFEWCRRGVESGDDTAWVKELLRATVEAATGEARECLLLGEFKHLFQVAAVRQYFCDWASGSEALAGFYSEACELADGFIELEERKSGKRLGR